MEDFRIQENFLQPPRSQFVKPIVAMKTGKSDIGSKAALSHTGSVAGSDAIYDGAFRQAGIIRARTILEFYDTVRAFAKQPVQEGIAYPSSRIWADLEQFASMKFPRQ